jgi:outer membrane receptor protein involved in Fe transport
LNVNYSLFTAKRGHVTMRVVANYLDRLKFIGTSGARHEQPRRGVRAEIHLQHRTFVVWQHEIDASVDVIDRVQFYGGANNVFAQKPDVGTNTHPVNSLGRYLFVGARVTLPRL